MLRKEDYYMIHQLTKDGVFQAEIAHQLGCSTRTIRRQLALPAPHPRTRQKPSKLDRYKSFIDARLNEDVWNASVIFQELLEQGFKGSCSLVRAYIQPKRALRPSKATMRFETCPGKQLQHDWGEIKVQVNGQKTKVYFAVNTLSSSRRFHVWAAPKIDAEHTHQSFIESFEYFEGVPAEVLVDNQKACVIHHPLDGRVEFNEGFRELALHYDFQPKACKPRRPQTKGKTERMVGYVKANFFVRYQSFESFEHVNQLLQSWLSTVADQRFLRQFQQTPMDRFDADQAALKPLPAQRYDTSYCEYRQVSWDGYIEAKGNRYSVPSTYCGQSVKIRMSLSGELRVFNTEDQLITQHRLQPKSFGWVTATVHHQVLRESVQRRSLGDYEEACYEA